MKFLILSRLPEIYSTRRLTEEIRRHKHQSLVQSPESTYENLDPDVIIPRIGGFRYEETLEKLQRYRSRFPSKVILNSPPAFHHARHKQLALDILRDIPQPERFPDPLHFPIIVKACLMTQGDGVFLCHNDAELKKCLEQIGKQDVIFQEYIEESTGRDIRAFVVGNRFLAAIERTSANPLIEFRANLSQGGSGKKTKLTDEEQRLAIESVRRLNLNYAGVDFLRTQRGPLLLEVNPSPGLEGIETITGMNIAQEIILLAESLALNS